MNYRKLDKYLELFGVSVRSIERLLGPDDDWVEDDRRIAYEAAQRYLGHLHTFVYEKGPADYVTTVQTDPETVEQVLMNNSYQRNLLSARKYRIHHDGGKQWACGSYVIDNLDSESQDSVADSSDDESDNLDGGEYTEQHHVYLFKSPNGGTDLYAHRETSVTEGAEHLTDTNQQHAAVGPLFDIFDRNGLTYGKRDV